MSHKAVNLLQQIASPKIWAGVKKLGWGKLFDFRRITLFCLKKRLSKHKMTMFSKNLRGPWPFGPPGYAYVHNVNRARPSGLAKYFTTGQKFRTFCFDHFTDENQIDVRIKSTAIRRQTICREFLIRNVRYWKRA